MFDRTQGYVSDRGYEGRTGNRRSCWPQDGLPGQLAVYLAWTGERSDMTTPANFLCIFCNLEIQNRDSRAKICWPCVDSNRKLNGQVAAMNAVSKAVRQGNLPSVKTLLCVDCGKPGQCYDHRDYNKPTEVEPVCRKCNKRRGSAKPLVSYSLNSVNTL